jgi:outer membrane protein OmpA-like peptidoglycan-associated protein
MSPHRFLCKILFAGILLILFSFSAHADDDGRIKIYINATLQSNRTPLEDVTVSVFRDNTEMLKLTTNKKGKIEIELVYGAKYRIMLSKSGLVSTYFLLDGNVPKAKYIINAGFDQIVYLVDKKQRDIDTLKFKHPFTKWEYNLKTNRFQEDVDYLKEFEEGVFKDDVQAAHELALKQEREKAEKDAFEKLQKEKAEAERKKREALVIDYKKKVRIAGKVFTSDNTYKPVIKAKVVLFNAQGAQIETTTTNALGGFAFARLSNDENFVLEIDNVDPQYLVSNRKIVLATKSGKQMLTMGANNKGSFRFQFMAADKNMIAELTVNDSELRVDILGKILRDDQEKKPIPQIKINLRDEKGSFVQSVMTDKNGHFKFRNLSSQASYAFDVEESDTKLKTGEKMLLTNDSGKVIQELVKAPKGGFKFEVLPADQNSMTTIYADDPWLKVIDPSWPKEPGTENTSLVIKEHIYFKSNDASLLPDAQSALNEVIHVMENVPDISIELSSHTDSKGSDEYNMTLSQRRAKAAVDYIASKGIKASRISGKGYGETQLVNKCGNGIECSEEEHAQNRRIEFKVIRK